MNSGLDFPDRTMPLPPPSDTQLRRLAPDLNDVTSDAALLLLSDRTTPFLATPPIRKDDDHCGSGHRGRQFYYSLQLAWT